MRAGSRVAGGDGFVVGINDKILLVHRPRAKKSRAREAAGGVLELNGRFCDGRCLFLVMWVEESV